MTKSSDTRRILIETTALKLFAERGYAEVSVRDIAQACGIGESALYRHMTSKEELAARVFREAYLGFAEDMRGAVSESEDLATKLLAYLQIMLEGFETDPTLMRFLLIRQHDTLSKAITTEDTTPLTLVRDALLHASRRAEIDLPDPDLATAQVMGAALQPVTFMFHGRLPAPATAHLSGILEGLKRLLGLT
jgi:AcrR family transcriptional regulator